MNTGKNYNTQDTGTGALMEQRIRNLKDENKDLREYAEQKLHEAENAVKRAEKEYQDNPLQVRKQILVRAKRDLADIQEAMRELAQREKVTGDLERRIKG